MSSVFRQPLVLPEDVVLTPLAEIAEPLRSQIGGEAGDFVLSRAAARSTSTLIDGNAAALLQGFRSARTIAQAIARFSRERKLDAEKTLEESLPLLRQLIAGRLLVPEASEGTEPIRATLDASAMLGDYRPWRCLQVLEDSEVYQARTGEGTVVALKVARPGREDLLRARLAREAAALGRLDGVVGPELVELGEAAGRPFLAQTWLPGVSAPRAAAEARAAGERDRLLRLLREIAGAYAALHQRGVVHGDVHPGNVLVDRGGGVALIDFGLAELPAAGEPSGPRGGVGFFYEPEWARAMRSGERPPPATAAGEQYAVAALLYLLAAGDHYLDFQLDSETMLGQIVELPPRSFRDAGAEPWPELETALARALAKQPERRYPDVQSFAEALAAVPVGPVPPIPVGDSSAYLVEAMLEAVDVEGELFRDGLPAGPVCSVNLGAAGIAYALYRLACLRESPELLAQAEVWIRRSQRDQDREDAFTNPELDMTPEITGDVSIYHTAAGIDLVRALIARATGDLGELTEGLTGFVETSRKECRNRDLTLGRCGTVLACALLLETDLEAAGGGVEPLRALGAERLAELWREVEPLPALADCEDWPNLGIAHGWAGLIYVTLRWHEATGGELPGQLAGRLAQLIDCALPEGRGVAIPWREQVGDNDAAMPGWCNGSAGLVHLACLAHRLLEDERLAELAEAAAWNAWEASGELIDLCCGLAGRAYALLACHELSGDPAWLARAKALAHRAARSAPAQRLPEHPRHSLYKGELGLALLLAELERPDSAAMPVFARET